MDHTSVVITGASSGIGAALAVRLAKPGRRMTLVGRDRERLSQVASLCRAKQAECTFGAVDLRDHTAMAAFFARVEEECPADLLVANAGILDGRHAGDTVETGAVARRVIETNLLSAVDVVHCTLPGMRRRGKGTIVLVSSLAAMVPLPDAPAYSASKAGLLSYGIALRDCLAAEGIRVVVACPGYVSTAMARLHAGPRPGEISAEDAAAEILRAIDANRGLAGFPFIPHWLSRLTLLSPEWLRRHGMRYTRFHVDH